MTSTFVEEFLFQIYKNWTSPAANLTPFNHLIADGLHFSTNFKGNKTASLLKIVTVILVMPQSPAAIFSSVPVPLGSWQGRGCFMSGLTASEMAGMIAMFDFWS